MTEHPRDQNVTSFEGTIMLNCTATGFPAPTITWFHNNTMEDNTSYTSGMINNYTTRSTFILSIPATSDSMYLCRAAINGYDDVDSSRITVLVQGESLFFLIIGDCIYENTGISLQYTLPHIICTFIKLLL